MDLKAFCDIEVYEDLMKNVEIPRLRGYSLCVEDSKFTKKEIEKITTNIIVSKFYHYFLDKFVCNGWSDFEVKRKRKNLNKYFILDEDGYFIDFKMENIHGKERKFVKLFIKHYSKEIERYFKIWNKYAGKENIMRVHSRIGSTWAEDGKEVRNKPWYLEFNRDIGDRTYCDIYVDLSKI